MTDAVELELIVPPEPDAIELLVPADPEAVELLVPGETGPAGAAAQSYVHQQPTASALWVVNHNLGQRPSVTVLSVGGMEVGAAVVHASLNQVLVSFNQPAAGSARCI